MRNLAMAAFLGSSAVTGVSLTLLWAFAVQQALVLGIAGPPLMLLTGGVAATTRSQRYSDLPPLLRVTRLPPRQPSRNGHRKFDVLVGMPNSSVWPGRVERQ